MKINKSLLIAALSLLALSGLMAKQQPKKDAVPGVAPQPAEFFYTGKPYDDDLGAYSFNYRNYDPSVARWTSVDPSGFPDGANAFLYVTNNPISLFDDIGLKSIAIVFMSCDYPKGVVNGQMTYYDKTLIAGALNAFTNTLRTNMQNDDSSSETNAYLSDGDTLGSVNVVSDLAGIQSSMSSYDKIILYTHGVVANGI